MLDAAGSGDRMSHYFIAHRSNHDYHAVMPSFYIVTYMPLVGSKAGRLAAEAYGLPPFIDGSIRREPDLEHRYPSISCLCRTDRFAPRLQVGNIVAYMTKKAKGERRLTAVLKVHRVCASHRVAAQWYTGRRLPLPRNCMVRGNRPELMSRSHRIFEASDGPGDAAIRREWDSEYRRRAREHGTFVICKPLFRDLSWEAPVVSDRKLMRTFGHTPGTLNPGAHSLDRYCRLMKLLRIPVPPSCR